MHGLRRGQIYFNAERLKHVRAAGLRSNRPVTMLGDGHAGGGTDDGGGRGNVDGAEAVASGADDIENFTRTGLGRRAAARWIFRAARGQKRRFLQSSHLFSRARPENRL